MPFQLAASKTDTPVGTRTPLPDGSKLSAEADREMAALGSVVFTDKVAFTQLPVFMMMSYAERLSPGVIYKSSSGTGRK